MELEEILGKLIDEVLFTFSGGWLVSDNEIDEADKDVLIEKYTHEIYKYYRQE